MNKKGIEFFEIPMWLVRMFYLILAMLSVILIISYFIVTEVDVQRTEGQVLASYIYYSPYGLAYTDNELAYSAIDPGRIIPGIVNTVSFPDEGEGTLTGFVPGNSNIQGAKVTVGEGDDAKVAYYNKDIYDRLAWLATASPKEGPAMVIEYKNMLVITSSGIESKLVKIEVVTQNI
jgi:hypothetical protein